MSDIIFNLQNEVIDLKNKNKADFKSLAKDNKLFEKFILENADFLDWNIVSENQALTPEIMVTCAKKIKWAKIPANPHIGADALLVSKYKGNANKLYDKEKLSDDFLRTHKAIFDWKEMNTSKLSNDLLDEMADKINWEGVFYCDRKDEAFVRKNLFRLDALLGNDYKYYYLTKSQTVSEQFLRDFESKIRFDVVAAGKNHTLSDAFVEDFKYALNPKDVIKTQSKNLSKAYLADYKKFDIEAAYQNATEEWIKSQPAHRLNWGLISKFTPLSEDFIFDFFEKLDLNNLLRKYEFSEDFTRKISKHLSEYDWKNLFTSQSYSEAFLEENIKKVKLDDISYGKTIPNLSEDFIRKYQSKWYWKGIGQSKRFSENFLREFADRWDWDWNIGNCQRVSESFLREFKHKFGEWGWRRISENQILTEDFMREFADKLHFGELAEHQVLSEKFIRDFKDNFDWSVIAIYQNISEEMKKEFADKIGDISKGNDSELMLRYNQIAWRIFEGKKDDKAKLEQGLEWIEKSLAHRSKTDCKDIAHYSDDTKVRLLLALNRQEEAYPIVKWALGKDKNFKDFQDFKSDKNYLEWLKKYK